MRLHGHVHPAVYPTLRELYFEPDSLLATIYTSFALELVGRDRQRALCAREACGKYFLVRHKRQRYCDDHCRKRAHEQRKQRQVTETGP